MNNNEVFNKKNSDIILYDSEKLSKMLKKIAFVLFLIAFIVIFIFSIIFTNNLGPVDSDSEEEVTFVVETGTSKTQVINALEKQGLIKNAFYLKLYLKFNNIGTIYAGTYNVSKSMSSIDIIGLMTSTSNSLENETVNITFVEGKRFTYYVEKIADNFDYTEEEILEYASNKDYLKTLIDKYWFITNDILDEEIYYPLEGYLFPDTYSFKKNATLDEIFGTFLDEMDNKLSIYKDEINLSGYSVHSLLTVASMVELEAVSAEDRLDVASVIYNRLKDGSTLGLDVTTYYGAQVEQNYKNFNKANVCNAYNTRSTCVQGLPVGPICSPSLSSIVAAIEPSDTNYFWFVADINHKVYFGTKEDSYFNTRKKKELCSENLWPDGNC